MLIINPVFFYQDSTLILTSSSKLGIENKSWTTLAFIVLYVSEYTFDFLPFITISTFSPIPALIFNSWLRNDWSSNGYKTLKIKHDDFEETTAWTKSSADKSVPRYMLFHPEATDKHELTKHPSSAFCPLGVAIKAVGLSLLNPLKEAL